MTQATQDPLAGELPGASLLIPESPYPTSCGERRTPEFEEQLDRGAGGGTHYGTRVPGLSSLLSTKAQEQE